jgi:glyoxylase-like metal-dependent hydrolase (beta-lactamase superfamily II)
VAAGRLLDGESDLFPGVRTVHTGGHTPGDQMVSVDTPEALAIITGDAAYVKAINVDHEVPFGYWVDLPEVMAGLRRTAADSQTDHAAPARPRRLRAAVLTGAGEPGIAG